ncbi:MAG: PRTRC system ThiF family protein [Chloroflexi bacterium]|nr:PRTRC system ThiF family protein [Chloroflexota bacterium]MBU1749100.1 PRTRC system ThiF family protein [Chloroflexota bacterium]
MPKLSIEQRYPIMVGDAVIASIILVGCGGTGSFLALHLARLAYDARARGLQIALTFVDHDTVQSSNLGRQNFVPAEVGQSKAWALMQRYNRAFGLSIAACSEPYTAEMLQLAAPERGHYLGLVLGCVDNHLARTAIHQALVDRQRYQNRWWWLDAGNSRHAGQVLLGNSAKDRPVISPLGFCTELPWPSVQHPELLLPDPTVEPQPVTCAGLAAAQSLMVNQAVAAYAAQYVYRLLALRNLDTYATYVDLQSGSARSLGICRPKRRRKKAA